MTGFVTPKESVPSPIIAQPASLHAVNSRAATGFALDCERNLISLIQDVQRSCNGSKASTAAQVEPFVTACAHPWAFWRGSMTFIGYFI